MWKTMEQQLQGKTCIHQPQRAQHDQPSHRENQNPCQQVPLKTRLGKWIDNINNPTFGDSGYEAGSIKSIILPALSNRNLWRLS